jgi:hypothetical protein
MTTPKDMLLSKGLPAIPGSLWAMLAKLSWANPDLVRPHILEHFVALQGAAGIGGGGVATQDAAAQQPPDAPVAAKRYFLVEEIRGFVRRDPVNPLEAESAYYVNVQIEDQEHQYPLSRAAFNMGPVAGTATLEPRPLRFDTGALLFLPSGLIQSSFTALQGFPTGLSALTGLTTRRAGIQLHGYLVNEAVVDNLLDMNMEELRATDLLHKRRAR